jgi:nucleoside 2-deoxyribosyltransferase
MNVYLAGSMAGGRDFADGLAQISRILIKIGHKVLTPFVVDDEINIKRFPGLKGSSRAKAIFEEDLDLVTQSDVIIAEVSQPSTGVGVELGYTVGLIRLSKKKKPMLLLRHKSLESVRNSSLILGNPHATFTYYEKASLEKIIDKFFQDLKRKL